MDQNTALTRESTLTQGWEQLLADSVTGKRPRVCDRGRSTLMDTSLAVSYGVRLSQAQLPTQKRCVEVVKEQTLESPCSSAKPLDAIVEPCSAVLTGMMKSMSNEVPAASCDSPSPCAETSWKLLELLLTK